MRRDYKSSLVDALSCLKDLLAWYHASRRVFPWRSEQPDPYAVWIVEVMSQQSTMASVLPFFERWMKQFPTLEVLAEASESQVLQAWAGLGYYSRARNAHKAARALRDYRIAHRGKWPPRVEDWLDLPGVGPYTAAAVAAIALGEPVLPVDGNLIRVFSRLYEIEDALNLPADRRRVGERVTSWARAAPLGTHGDLAQAFMDLGARVCRPGPLATCELCPLAPGCAARQTGSVAAIPRAKIRKETKKIQVLALTYRQPKTREVLVRKIPHGRLLEGQWELPQWELQAGQGEQILRQVGLKFELSGPVKHTITHHAFEVWRVEAGDWPEALPPDHAWAVQVSPLTTLTRKLFA